MENIKIRAIEASVSFLTRHGYEILAREWESATGGIDIVAVDDGELAFVSVTVSDAAKGFREPATTRASREAAAARWLAEDGGEFVDSPVRFDDIAMMVMGSRALIRHHINSLSTSEG